MQLTCMCAMESQCMQRLEAHDQPQAKRSHTASNSQLKKTSLLKDRQTIKMKTATAGVLLS